MHVRYSTMIGMALTEDGADDAVGSIAGILLHPVELKVEGFFVSAKPLSSEPLFLAVHDILHLGNRVRVRSTDVLSPADERVRLLPLLEDPRTVLGQKMVTQSGRIIGRCRDVQYETKTFQLEWLFPKRFFRWQVPIPRTSIVQV